MRPLSFLVEGSFTMTSEKSDAPGMRAPEGLFEREPEKTIPKRYLQGIGKVIVSHSRLEHYLTELIADLQRTDYSIVRQVLDGTSTRDHVTRIAHLLDMWKIIPVVGLEQLRADVEKAAQKRNEVAHGVWLRTPQQNVALRRTRGDRLTSVGQLSRRVIPQTPPTKVEMFKAYADYIDGVIDRVRKLQSQAREQLDPWPYISPQRRYQHPWHPTRDRNGKTREAPR